MPSPVSRKRLWAGRTLSALATLFLLFDSVIKLMKIAPVSQEMILNFLGEHVLGMPRSY